MARAKKDQPQLTTAQQLGSLIKSARDIMRKDKGLSTDIDRLPMLTWIMFLKFLDDMERLEEEKAGLAGTPYHAAIEPPYRWRDWAAQEAGITGPELLAFVAQEECTRPDGTHGPGLLPYLRSLQNHDGDGARRRNVIGAVFKDVANRMLSGYLLRDVVNKVDGIHFLAKPQSTAGLLGGGVRASPNGFTVMERRFRASGAGSGAQSSAQGHPSSCVAGSPNRAAGRRRVPFRLWRRLGTASGERR